MMSVTCRMTSSRSGTSIQCGACSSIVDTTAASSAGMSIAGKSMPSSLAVSLLEAKTLLRSSTTTGCEPLPCGFLNSRLMSAR